MYHRWWYKITIIIFFKKKWSLKLQILNLFVYSTYYPKSPSRLILLIIWCNCYKVMYRNIRKNIHRVTYYLLQNTTRLFVMSTLMNLKKIVCLMHYRMTFKSIYYPMSLSFLVLHKTPCLGMKWIMMFAIVFQLF